MSAPSAGPPLAGLLVAWDALAAAWRLDNAERGALMPAGLTGPPSDPASWRSDAAEHRMRLLVRIGALAAEVHRDEDRVRWWLRRPNAALSGRAPLDVMAESSSWMEWLVRSMETSL